MALLTSIMVLGRNKVEVISLIFANLHNLAFKVCFLKAACETINSSTGSVSINQHTDRDLPTPACTHSDNTKAQRLIVALSPTSAISQ